MSRITDAFRNTKAFIAFITCGDPDIDTTRRLVRIMADNGADLIELGLPFSDPVAEGPVIQDADVRALKAHTTADDIFAMVEKLRAEGLTTPLLIMTYVNPVFVYGKERFLARCEETGVDGIIVPDTPFEEKEELSGFCDRHHVDLISMIAPTSRERIRAIAREAQGFLYCVSSLGVTGVRATLSDAVGDMVAEVKRMRPDLPCAVGFGIATPEQSEHMARLADGVIVGSAIVRLVARYGREGDRMWLPTCGP